MERLKGFRSIPKDAQKYAEEVGASLNLDGKESTLLYINDGITKEGKGTKGVGSVFKTATWARRELVRRNAMWQGALWTNREKDPTWMTDG